jgi:hypothetical protein
MEVSGQFCALTTLSLPPHYEFNVRLLGPSASLDVLEKIKVSQTSPGTEPQPLA